MDVKQKVIESVLNHLPSGAEPDDWVPDGENDLTFFLDPSCFPVGEDLGTNRQNWNFAFTWLDGLEITYQDIEVIHFEWPYKSSEFKGAFTFEEMVIQVLGDCDPPRGLSPEELNFLKSTLPEACTIFVVGVYRPEISRTTKSGLPTLGLDGLVCYHRTLAKPRNRKGLNTLKRLAEKDPATLSNGSEPQRGSQGGSNFVKNLLK